MKPILAGLGATLVTLTLLGAAVAAPVDSLSPSSAARFTDEAMRGAALKGALQAAAQDLRTRLIADPTKTLAALPALDRAVLQGALGRLEGPGAAGVGWFFRGAPPQAAKLRDGSVSFYNPIADLALSTLWRRIDGRWRLVSARIVDGAQLRPGSLKGLWSDVADDSYQRAFAGRASLSRAVFAYGFDAPASSGGVDTLIRRVTMARAGVLEAESDSGLNDAARRLRAAIARADPQAAGFSAARAPSRQSFETVDPPVRETLEVLAAYRRADGRTLVFASPLRPELFLFADYDVAGAPVSLSVVNLANASSEAQP